MSAKPSFKPRVCYVDGDNGRTLWNGKRTGTGAGLFYPRRVRVVDYRDLTAEKAVEGVLQMFVDEKIREATYGVVIPDLFNLHLGWAVCDLIPAGHNMTARVVNGNVKVRRAKQ